MGTSNKLNYLNETKELIKEALIEQDVEVADTDTFRSYADKIKSISTGITPEGTMLIQQNGIYDVTTVAEVDVQVENMAEPPNTPVFGFATFNENGEYNAEDYDVDGWSFVKVEVAGSGGTLTKAEIVGEWYYFVESDNANSVWQFAQDGTATIRVRASGIDIAFHQTTYTIEDNSVVVADIGTFTYAYDDTTGATLSLTQDDVTQVFTKKSIYNFQEKTVTENGEVVADSGYDGLSKLTVNVAGSGDLNLIERTITDMNLSSGQFEILPTYTEPYNADLDLSTIEVDKGEATYGFVYDSSTGRLEPTNKGQSGTYSYGKINFSLPADGNTITITVYQSSEANYDYGFISDIDKSLTYSNSTSEPDSVYNSKGLGGEYTYTFTDVPAGEHFITFKYRKDNSGNTGADTFAIVKINVDGNTLVSTDGLTKATIIKPDDLVSENIMKDKEVFGIKGKLYVPEYQKTTTTVMDVLAGKKFITETGVLAEGTIEEYSPEDSYTQNTVLLTGGKFVTKNILINVTPEAGARDTMETYYEMKRTDFLRQQMGVVGLIDLPTEEEYLEQQTIVNNLIEKITGVPF